MLAAYHANDPIAGMASSRGLGCFKLYLADTGLFTTLSSNSLQLGRTTKLEALKNLGSYIQFRRYIYLVRNILSVLFPLPHAFCQQVFDLAVDGAKVIFCPRCNGIVKAFRKP